MCIEVSYQCVTVQFYILEAGLLTHTHTHTLYLKGQFAALREHVTTSLLWTDDVTDVNVAAVCSTLIFFLVTLNPELSLKLFLF